MLPLFDGLRPQRFGSANPFTGDTEVCVDSQELLQPFFLCEPPEQVRLFILLFCTSVAAGLVLHHQAAAKYYRWFVSSKVAPNKHRGLGYNTCQAYGIFPIPALPVFGFHAVSWLFLASLMLSCHPGLAPRFFLFTSFGLYFLYFGQLFCESKHGGHGSLLLPSVFMLLALSGGPQSTPWSLVFIKLFVGCVYFVGALSKLVVSAFFGKPWTGSTMQAYLIDAMWSRPHRWPIARWFQQFLVTRWWACTGMALAGLLFELGFLPLILFGGHVGAVLASTVALSFHLGVDVVQGLDFKPFWCPVFWAFLPDFQALLSGHAPPEDQWAAVMARGFEEEPCRWLASAVYLGLQVIVGLGFFDLRGKECLPLTCCPMFAVPRNIFGDEPRGCLMTEFNLRDAGYLDCAYNYAPWSTATPLDAEALDSFPGRMVMWMSTLHVDPLIRSMVQPEALDKDFLVAANFELQPVLTERLAAYFQFLENSKAEDWADGAKVSEALAMQEQIRGMFDEEVREAVPIKRNITVRQLAAMNAKVKPLKEQEREESPLRQLLDFVTAWLLVPAKTES